MRPCHGCVVVRKEICGLKKMDFSCLFSVGQATKCLRTFQHVNQINHFIKHNANNFQYSPTSVLVV